MVGEVAVFGEILAVFEVDDRDFGIDCGILGLSGEFDEGAFRFGKMIIGDVRSGTAEDARDFEVFSDKTSQAQSGVARRVFLIISSLVGFVNHDEA